MTLTFPNSRLATATTSAMGYQKSQKAIHSEARLQEAILALKNKGFATVYTTAKHFKVDRKTLKRRVDGGMSRTQALEIRQILSNAEEKTLIRWIIRYTIAGSPISSALLIEIV